MSLTSFILQRIAALLHVPTAAVEMLRAANVISGIEKNSLPTELVSLNALQFSRGLLNFSFFQSNLRWIFPYWAVRQYDPADISFIPRAHLGLSMNLTHRNWTAVGSPDCTTEPIVDPRGLVTPFRDGWSIDTWISIDGTTYFPSRLPARQYRHHHYPVVITEFTIEGILLRLSTFVNASTVFHYIRIVNTGAGHYAGSVMVALRPFNPEGVGMITSLASSEEGRRVIINGDHSIFFSETPASSCCSNYADGDSAWRSNTPGGEHSSSVCDAGFANGFYRFQLSLDAGQEKEIEVRVPLDGEPLSVPGGIGDPSHDQLRKLQEYWDELLQRGASIETPDTELNAGIQSNIITLLMLCDGNTITPGPSAYHHFWFRDAAFMLHALDSFGHHDQTRPIIENFFSHQEPNGYFRSQKGEWDSNGQAIWVIHEHTLLSGSDACVQKKFPALLQAVQWIDHKRVKGITHAHQPYYGLVPAGLSAEHLGLADHYYWDNFWSLAGVRSFNALCSFVSAYDDQQYGQQLFDDYLRAIDKALRSDECRLSAAAMPAAPGRGIDCGIIGSLSALYPLQLYELGEERLQATVEEIVQRFCVDELFFQHFIHSGSNIYLSLQVAHACLLLGERKKFSRILSSVARHASPTGTYPEAIHPITGGGSMGDGHHGWAAAEFILAVRAMFILETAHEVRFLCGTPEEWYTQDKHFSLRNAPTHSGKASIAVRTDAGCSQIQLAWEPHGISHHTRWCVKLPYRASSVTVDGSPSVFSITSSDETDIILAPGPCTIVAKR